MKRVNQYQVNVSLGFDMLTPNKNNCECEILEREMFGHFLILSIITYIIRFTPTDNLAWELTAIGDNQLTSRTSFIFTYPVTNGHRGATYEPETNTAI